MLRTTWKGIHWLAPTTIILSLFSGFLLALGHHLFYSSLDGQNVSIDSYRLAGFSLPKQQFNTSIGVAFALLVKTFLAIAISVSFIQLFWKGVKDAGRPPTLEGLDWAFSRVNNIFGLYQLKFWGRYPALVALAVGFSCIPIATVFPPATLSVRYMNKIAQTMLEVPQFDFTSMKFVRPLLYTSDFPISLLSAWSGPSAMLQNIASRAMVLGQILPITTPEFNMTWKENLWGPALSCNNVRDAERAEIFVNIWNSYNFSNTTSGTTKSGYAYLSWIKWSEENIPWEIEHNGSMGKYLVKTYNLAGHASDQPTTYLGWHEAFILNFGNGTWTEEVGSRGPPSGLVSQSGPMSIFFAIMPRFVEITTIMVDSDKIVRDFPYHIPNEPDRYMRCVYEPAYNLTDPLLSCRLDSDSILVTGERNWAVARAFDEATLLRCDLVNRSYSAEFNFFNGQQNIRIKPNVTQDLPINGLGMLNTTMEAASVTGNSTNIPVNRIDPSSLRQFSYQGMMAAFSQMVLGSIQTNRQATAFEGNMSIMSTVLADTEELAFLRNWEIQNVSRTGGFYELSHMSLQHLMSESKNASLQALFYQNPGKTRGKFKDTVEQLFENFTFSLLAEPIFLPNYSSEWAPEPLTNVSIHRYQNIYKYNPFTLWIAYGLSILFTTIAAIAGLTAIALNRASYSTSFSTIVRVAKTSNLDVDITDQKSDGFGRDPLPDYLKHARLDVRGEKDKTESDIPLQDTIRKRNTVQETAEASSQEEESLVARSEHEDVLQHQSRLRRRQSERSQLGD